MYNLSYLFYYIFIVKSFITISDIQVDLVKLPLLLGTNYWSYRDLLCINKNITSMTRTLEWKFTPNCTIIY